MSNLGLVMRNLGVRGSVLAGMSEKGNVAFLKQKSVVDSDDSIDGVMS
jgi:hypothetical protein